jgi:hypothetical protein
VGARHRQSQVIRAAAPLDVNADDRCAAISLRNKQTGVFRSFQPSLAQIKNALPNIYDKHIEGGGKSYFSAWLSDPTELAFQVVRVTLEQGFVPASSVNGDYRVKAVGPTQGVAGFDIRQFAETRYLTVVYRLKAGGPDTRGLPRGDLVTVFPGC